MLAIDAIDAGYRRVPVLQDVTFDVPTGNIVCLMGANGAGKSTTLLCIAGVVAPTRGRITLDEQLVSGLVPENVVRRGISLVPERRRIFTTLTVAENLSLGATVRRRAGDVAEDRDAALARFPVLRRYFTSPAGRLSGGEQQQLAIARALMARPRVLMLDEPSLGLAPQMVDAVFEALTELRQQGITIVLVEQLAQRACEIADAVHVLRSGRIVLSSETPAKVSAEQLEEAYFGSSGDPRQVSIS